MKKSMMKTVIVVLALICTLSASMFCLTACNEGEHLSRDIVFEFDGEGTSVFGYNYNLISSFALDDDECYIKLSKDGTIHAQVKTNDTILKLLVNEFDDLIGGIDLQAAIDMYVAPMFPGFTLDDIEGSLDLVKNGVGFSITGINFADDKIAALVDYIKENKKIPEDMGDYIPTNLSLCVEFDSTYTFEIVTGEDGKKYNAIYIGDLANRKDTQPFGVLTLDMENQKQTLSGRVEFLQFALKAVEA